MGFWNNGGFFSSVKGHVIKWWQFVLMPVLRINNNSTSQPVKASEQPAKDQIQQPVEQPVKNEIPQSQEHSMNETMPQSLKQSMERSTQQTMSEEPRRAVKEVNQAQQPDEQQVEQKKTATWETEDAMEILNRINQEKENERKKDIEKARRQASEEARIAAIMNANKVDVNAFIEAGRAAKEEIAAKKAANEEQIRNELAQKKAIEVQQATAVKMAVDEELEKKRKQEEDLRRAQEIMDRLNREAAEDEAKKQAEIDAAKQEAKKQFG